jgi:hypothetical protein
LPTNSVTARYLAELEHPVLPFPETHSARIRFAGRYLSRPAFLEAREFSELERDLSLIWSALSTLPHRLYGGDLKAFAQAVGLTGAEAECVARGAGTSPQPLTHMGRPDIYRDATGFRLLEWNLGSTVGGVESVDLCHALGVIPEVAGFLAREGLTYRETYQAFADTLRYETGYPVGRNPVVALVESPRTFREAEEMMLDKAARLARYGLSTMIGHLGELVRDQRRLCLRGTPVDVVYRTSTLEELLVHLEDGLLEPLLSAAEAGEVRIFTSMDSEVYGSKAAIALLSDPAGQVGLSPDGRAACDRLLPWTRRVRAGETRLDDGTPADLFPYMLEHQGDLVLKPSLSFGGHGVVVGAAPDVTRAVWRDAVAQAAQGAYVVQWLVRPLPELFRSADSGHLAPWTVLYGPIMMRAGYAGMITRAVPADAGAGIVNVAGGAFVGCGFHAEP